MSILPEIELVKFNEIKSKEPNSSSFVLEPLLPGYGMTMGNSLRRVLLSSLGGSAITAVKIEGVSHEFSTLPGLKEDVVELILNIKALRVKLKSKEPALIKLVKKGPAVVKAKDFVNNPDVEIIDPEFVIANLDKKGKLDLQATVEMGRGYLPTEQRKDQKLPLGTIAIDSIFTPIKKVQYEVERTRVGGMTNFDKLTISITTDGTITPKEALQTARNILVDFFVLIAPPEEKKAEKKGVKNLNKSKKKAENREKKEKSKSKSKVVQKPVSKGKTAKKSSQKSKK